MQHRDTPWYRCVEPTWAPPRWVYPLVWTPLYAALTAALALSATPAGGPPVVVQAQVVNLWLSVLWCQLFFAERRADAAAVVLLGILALSGAIITRTRRRIVRTVFLVYAVWCSFALLLNLGALQRDRACGCSAAAAAAV